MTITDSEVAMLRDCIHDHRWELSTGTAQAQSDSTETADTARTVTREFRVLAGAACTIAVHRRLAPACTRGDVVRFVANARASHRGLADALDPRVAEWVILYATRHEVSGSYSANRGLSTRLDLLRVLVWELGLDTAGVEDLLAEARRLADRWIANQERRRRR